MAAFDLTAYLKQLQAAQDKANAANEKRYQDAIAEMRSGQGKIAGQFNAARTDVNMGATQAGATATQSLMSAGLGNTTIVQGAARGIESDRQRALTNIAGQQGTAEAGYSRDIANLMGQKNETGPDLGMYAGLLAQAASNPLTGFQGTGKIYNSSNGGGISNARVAGGGGSAFGGSFFGGGSSGGNFAGAPGTFSGFQRGQSGMAADTTPPPTPITPPDEGTRPATINGQPASESNAAPAVPAQPGDGTMQTNGRTVLSQADWRGLTGSLWTKFVGMSPMAKVAAWKTAYDKYRAGK